MSRYQVDHREAGRIQQWETQRVAKPLNFCIIYSMYEALLMKPGTVYNDYISVKKNTGMIILQFNYVVVSLHYQVT